MTTNKPAFEFWFDFTSTYSFLASQRIVELAAKAGAPITWRPFLLGVVLRECGWDGPPIANNPRKGAYMWRDLERQARQRGHGFTKPSNFPRHSVLANRVALIAANEGWAESFVPRTFAVNFIDDLEIAEPEVLARIIAACGHDHPDAVLARAQSEDNKAALKANTDEASARGIFGAPSFLIGNELFWGDDRLEAALEWWRAA